MKWKHPHIIKIYEALGTLADDRIEVIGNTARVYSSSRNKFYEVSFDLKNNSIQYYQEHHTTNHRKSA